ncbi:MAG: riboflavin biosynthesis protein RibF, partial [Candidatus Omnitrophica bacterium]|nr:riboflavin biosynthesis protein RibF [Candidatus Omnitrophota bacterium]
SLEHRLRLLQELGVQVCVIAKFDCRFAGISAEDFVRTIIIRNLGARAVFVGENFRFGRGARGDAGFLAREAQAVGVVVRLFKTVRFRGRAVSSSLIRRLITTGQLNRARQLLLRRVSVLGTVIRGSALGRMLGFPTANIEAHHEVLPPSGVYAVRVVLGKRTYRGACYIGCRPTFAQGARQAGVLCPDARRRVEVHIFNFRKDIYGRDLEVQFIKKIRPDKRFRNPEALARQIKKDITRIKVCFSRP